MSTTALLAVALAFVAAVTGFFVLQRVAGQLEAKGGEGARGARIMRAVAVFDLFFLPLAVYVATRIAGI